MVDYKDDIINAIEVLRSGGIILYPTDTIWGIGCDATNYDAVKKIYELKKREDSKNMLVLLDNINQLVSYVDDIPEVAYDIIELTDKPLTVIFDKGKNLATNLFADDGSIGIRITNESFSSELIRRFRKPIVSTSANISGEPTPRIFNKIAQEVKTGVDYIVKHRQSDTRQGIPSGIIKLGKGGLVQIVRE